MATSNAALVGVALLFGLFIGLAVNAVVCWIISSALGRIPAEHRKISPGQVWLLTIPCFPIIRNFVVFQRVPASFKSHFDSVGRGDVGDCGAAVGLWYSIVTIACCIPLLIPEPGEVPRPEEPDLNVAEDGPR